MHTQKGNDKDTVEIVTHPGTPPAYRPPPQTPHLTAARSSPHSLIRCGSHRLLPPQVLVRRDSSSDGVSSAMGHHQITSLGDPPQKGTSRTHLNARSPAIPMNSELCSALFRWTMALASTRRVGMDEQLVIRQATVTASIRPLLWIMALISINREALHSLSRLFAWVRARKQGSECIAQSSYRIYREHRKPSAPKASMSEVLLAKHPQPMHARKQQRHHPC